MRSRALWMVSALLLLGGCATTLDRARAAYRQGNADQAQALYREAMSDPDEGGIAREELADLLVDGARSVEKSDPERAEVTYRAALELFPAHDDALTGLVRLLRQASRPDDAVEAMQRAQATGSCASCKRLGAMVTLELAEAAMQAKDWDKAIKHFEEAQAFWPQPTCAIGIAKAHHEAGRLDQAGDALAKAADVVAGQDAQTLQAFSTLRSELVMAATTAGDMSLVDRVRGIAPAGLTASDQMSLSLAVADALRDKGQVDEAMKRYDELRKASAEGKLSLDAEQLGQLEQRLAAIHSRRATKHLHAGNAAEADAELAQALELDADNWTLKLQRILALAPVTGGQRALDSLQHVPAGTRGLKQVRAIVGALRATELMNKGDREGAQRAIEAAQASYGDMPEVHLAVALIVATSVTEDLSPAEMRSLRKASIVRYPGAVLRYAEALGELDSAISRAQNRGEFYAYRGPWFQRDLDALSTKLRAVYPFAVKFSADPEAQIIFKNTSGRSMRIQIQGPEGFTTDLDLAPGKERKVTVPDPGLVRLVVDGKRKTFLGESYAIVTLTL